MKELSDHLLTSSLQKKYHHSESNSKAPFKSLVQEPLRLVVINQNPITIKKTIRGLPKQRLLFSFFVNQYQHKSSNFFMTSYPESHAADIHSSKSCVSRRNIHCRWKNCGCLKSGYSYQADLCMTFFLILHQLHQMNHILSQVLQGESGALCVQWSLSASLPEKEIYIRPFRFCEDSFHISKECIWQTEKATSRLRQPF